MGDTCAGGVNITGKAFCPKCGARPNESCPAEAARVAEELARVERNRDMWKGQCERQAERLTSMRTALGAMLAEFEHCEHKGCGCLSCKAIASARVAISIISNNEPSGH